MIKTAFNRLKVGDRVTVTGLQDDQLFFNEPGVIVKNLHHGDDARRVMFDTSWAKGHGDERRCWNFLDIDVKGFEITVEKPKKANPKAAPKRAHSIRGKQNGRH